MTPMKNLVLILLTSLLLVSGARAESVDSTRSRKSMDAVLRETRDALDSALSFFRSPKFDSLKIELRRLAEDSRELARDLRFSADSIQRMIEPYMDSIKPYIDSLTDLGETLDENFEMPRNFSFKGFPKEFKWEGNLNELPDKNLFRWYDLPEEVVPMPNPENRERELRKYLPKKPKQFRAPQGEPRELFPVPPTAPEPGQSIPNYPGWKIQPLDSTSES